MREILVFDADYCWRLGCVASEFLMPPELDAECGETGNGGFWSCKPRSLLIVLNIEEVRVARPQIG